jgi:hypothetical protein
LIAFQNLIPRSANSASRQGLYEKPNELWMARPCLKLSNQLACHLFWARPCRQLGKHVVDKDSYRTGSGARGAFDSFIAHGSSRFPSRKESKLKLRPKEKRRLGKAPSFPSRDRELAGISIGL